MSKWIIEQNEAWTPGDCFTCQIDCVKSAPGFNPACPLANARKAVEVRDINEVDKDGNISDIPYSIDGKPVKLFAVEEDI